MHPYETVTNAALPVPQSSISFARVEKCVSICAVETVTVTTHSADLGIALRKVLRGAVLSNGKEWGLYTRLRGGMYNINCISRKTQSTRHVVPRFLFISRLNAGLNFLL